jgi:hypothetical protein
MVPMRNAVAAVVAAIVVTAVLTAGLTLGLAGYFQAQVARPSPTPTPTVAATPTPTVTSAMPSPTLSPTPSPTITATPSPRPTRTDRPDPTNSIAGQQLIPYYFQARQQFPIFPGTPLIQFDMAADKDGDAFFRGLTPAGQPIFTVREDFVMTPRTAFHEIGHAYEALLQRSDAGVDWRARYWAFRGFPGTWQDAAREAAAKTGTAQWIVQPQESWAEAFSIAMVGSGQEKTLDYGKTINPAATKAFFLSLTNP